MKRKTWSKKIQVANPKIYKNMCVYIHVALVRCAWLHRLRDERCKEKQWCELLLQCNNGNRLKQRVGNPNYRPVRRTFPNGVSRLTQNSQFYILFYFFHFQKIQILKLHNFFILNRKKWLLSRNAHNNKTSKTKSHFTCFFRMHFNFLYYFLHLSLFPKIISQIYIFNPRS